MAWPTSTFPTKIDTITDKIDNTDDVIAADINGAYDCIEKIEAKIGVNNSAVATSIDYLLKSTSSSNPGHKHTLAAGATDVTATAAEINTACDGSTAKNSHTHTLSTGASDVTATAAQVNTACAGATAKNSHTHVLAAGATDVTATAAEINTACDGSTAKNSHTHTKATGASDVTATAAEINAACDLTNNGFFATGTKVPFYQNTAPTGWTIQTTLNDKLLFVTKGSGAGGQTGGAAHSTGSWTLSGISCDNHTLVTTEIPGHTHTITAGLAGEGGAAKVAYVATTSGTSTFTGNSTGGGTGHNHTMTLGATWRPAAYSVIIAAKN